MARYMRILIVAKTLFFLLLFAPGIFATNNKGNGDDSKVDIDVSFIEDGKLVLKPQEKEKEVSLRVKTRDPKTSARVHLKVESLKRNNDESTVATACFVVDEACETSHDIKLGAGEQNKQEIKVRLKEMLRNDTYTLTISAAVIGKNASPIETTLVLKRPQIDFNPSISGIVVEKGEVILRPTNSEHKSFRFGLQNPTDGIIRTFELVDAVVMTADNTKKLSIEFCPKEILIAPGGKAHLQAEIDGEITASSYKGRFQVQDKNQPHYAWKEFPIVVEKVFEIETWWTKNGARMVWVAVFMGAIISVFLNRAAPRTITKRRYQMRIGQIAGRLERLGHIGHGELNIKLATMRQQLAFQCGRSIFFSSQEVIDDLDNSITSLEQQITVAEELSKQTTRFERTEELPRMQIVKGREYLRTAIWYLVNADADKAKEELTKASSLVFSGDSIGEVASALAKGIERIQNLELVEDDLPGNLKIEWEELNSNLPHLKSGTIQNKMRLLDLDRKFFKVQLFVERFRRDILLRATKNFADKEKELLGSLERGGIACLKSSEKMVRDMDTGFLPEEIIDRLQNGQASIEINPRQPKEGQQTILTINFGKPFDNSSAARELVYEWYFGDKTNPARGKRCAHFFKTTKKGAEKYCLEVRGQAPDGTWFLFGAKLKESNPEQYQKLIDSECTILGRGPDRLLTRTRKFILSVQTAVFVVSTLLAILVAWVTHFGEFSVGSWKDLLIPFLIGVGVDQFREKGTHRPKITIDKLVKSKTK